MTKVLRLKQGFPKNNVSVKDSFGPQILFQAIYVPFKCSERSNHYLCTTLFNHQNLFSLT